MYVYLCDFACLCLLIPFVLEFCLVFLVLFLFVCFLYVSVCVYVSLCDFVCLVLLFPFGMRFSICSFFGFFSSFSSEPCGWQGLGAPAGCQA